jgi:hypothetical protein
MFVFDETLFARFRTRAQFTLWLEEQRARTQARLRAQNEAQLRYASLLSWASWAVTQ